MARICSLRFEHLVYSACVAIAVCICSLPAHAVTIGPIYDSYSNSNLYIVGSTNATWSAAQAQAVTLGGNLITIHSSAENQFVASTFYKSFTGSGGPDLSNAIGLWLGLYDPTGLVSDDSAHHAADFTWVDGEAATYRNWNAGEPNDGGGTAHEYYSIMWGPDSAAIAGAGTTNPTGTWNDINNTYGGFYGIASIPVPEPISLGFVGLGSLLLLRSRRVRSIRNMN